MYVLTEYVVYLSLSTDRIAVFKPIAKSHGGRETSAYNRPFGVSGLAWVFTSQEAVDNAVAQYKRVMEKI